MIYIYNREVKRRKSGLKRIEALEKLDSEYGLKNIGASAMLIKALTRIDVYTLDIVQMYTREEVMGFKYIGPKTIDELSNLMDKYGFKYSTIKTWIYQDGLSKETRLCEDGKYRTFIDEKDLPCLLLPDKKKTAEISRYGC